jgi:poly(hydroxyalkanoate) depolymerase family esterase
MIMRRAKLMYLLQRWRRALAALRRRQLPLPASQPAEWTAAVYQEPGQRKLLGLRTRRRLHYRLYLPTDRSRRGSMPLLVMLHGCSQDAAVFAAGTRMNAIAEEHGCAVLYPEQSTSANPLRCWNWFDSDVGRGAGEASLVVRLVQEVMRREAVDARQVYIAGMSAGAALAGVLSLRWPDLFAASALHSGVMYAAAGSASEAMRVMRSGASVSPQQAGRRLLDELGREVIVAPVIVIHGAADTTVNPCNAVQIVAQRLAVAGLPGAGESLPAPSEEVQIEIGGRSMTQRDYAAGARLLVRSLLIDGLGHAWSGGDAQQRFNDAAGPDASRMMFDFLLRHRRGAPM